VSGRVRLITKLYRVLLAFYPARFRAEFGDEMRAVFEAAMLEAEKTDGPRMLALFAREIRDWPGAVWREHWSALTEKELSVTTIQKPEWSFYPAWIILTMLCVPIAFVLDLVILKVITGIVGDFIYVDGVRHITEDYLSMYTFFPVVGLLTGVLQYRLLHRYLPRMGWWVLATTGGWLLGALLLLISRRLDFWTSESFDVSLAFVVMGLSIGVGQWLLLRRRLPQAGWWIGANVVGWVLLSLITGDTWDQFDLLAVGFLPTCVTAVMFGLLMNQAQP
jgi:hypothetical protein